MNILIPHHWLLEHLETEASPEEIQKFLSLSGPSVERVYEKEAPVTSKTGTEYVYDIEVTTNRVDSMSIRGIAREAAVILTQAKLSSKLKPLQLEPKKQQDTLPLPTISDETGVCKRIMCVILKDVKRTATPDWMAERLILTEQNIHDSVIDITNYITHELGHPVHAFDYDKIMQKGGIINVKIAEKGKKFTTLDKQSYTTVGGEVVFENNDGEIIDLPAIKGTANTSIDDSTKNVLLWIENLPADKVRFSSMTHTIRTIAAQLSEKHVDPHLAESVLKRGIELYTQLCDATVASEIYDDFPAKKDTTVITVPESVFQRYLGVELSKQTITDILEALECTVVYELVNNTYVVTPPSFRPDLEIAADIVEEIARIYGYHNLPSTLMDGNIPTNKPKTLDFDLENRIKHFLADTGAQEVYCYSMVSAAIAQQSGYELKDHLALQNPLTDDRVYLRRSLVPSLQEVVDTNPMAKQLTVFEIANVYIPQPKTIPQEHLHLGLVSKKTYREVRGIIESLLSQFYLPAISITPMPTDLGIQEQMAVISTNTDHKVNLGTMSILKSGAVSCTISITELLRAAKKHPTYQTPATTARIIEDLTFTIPSGHALGTLLEQITSLSEYIKSVELGDIYKQNYSFTITYQDVEQNITSERVEPIRKEIVEKLKNEYKAELVGNL